MKKLSNRNTMSLKALFAAAALLLLPEAAFAAGTPVEDAVDWVLDLLTNGIARSVAIIAIVILGFMAFAGRLGGDLVAKFIVGIVLVFGGATLVDLLIGVTS